MTKLKLMWASAVAGAAFVGAGSAALADDCKPPSVEKQTEVQDYVAKRYHLGPSATKATAGAQANEACYWKFRYKTSGASELTVYLSPDGRFITPVLYDLSIDPAVEERIKAANLMKSLTAGSPPSLGSATAPVTIVEFSDFECPFCKHFTDMLEKELSPEDRKQVRVVFREFPLSMHPWARRAAEIAGCAALQSDAAFWKVHDYLFQNQGTLTVANISENVVASADSAGGIDRTQLQLCMDRKLSTGSVLDDMELAKANNVNATPTLFINGTRYPGAKDATQLHQIIADILHSQDQAHLASSPAAHK